MSAVLFGQIDPADIEVSADILPEVGELQPGTNRIGAEQLCLSTSYGVETERKFYLRPDLAARYQSLADLREGIEILRLYR